MYLRRKIGVGKMGKMGKMGEMGGSAKIAKNAQNTQNTQKWAFWGNTPKLRFWRLRRRTHKEGLIW